MIRYRYTHTSTEATTGYFSCEPHPQLSLDEALRSLSERPYDDFLRRHLLARMGGMTSAEIIAALKSAFTENLTPLPITSLAEELRTLNPDLEGIVGKATNGEALAEYSPLILLRWQQLPDRAIHQAWSRAFGANMRSHRAIKSPGEIGLPPLYPEQEETAPEPAPGKRLPGTGPAFRAPFVRGIDEVHPVHAARESENPVSHERPPSSETAALAEERLTRCGIIAGPEMRHAASLSPVALLRPWNIAMRVRNQRHDFSLDGTATTYGRGLSIPDARASCLMEMVERASCYLSVSECAVDKRAADTRLRRAPLSELLNQGCTALDPNDFPLEVPYDDAPLHWLEGHGPDGGCVFVPLQLVGLFCNLDEISLLDAPGSTGIATGCSLEEAKVAALLEILERDAEATTPFSKNACFTIEADRNADSLLASLLADYKRRGINVQFQDLTGPLGVPVYKCFVMSPKGAIAAGHGAGLSGRRALISALTETPFPYPDGGPSGPQLRKLPVRRLHELPDFSLATPRANLTLLEALLRENGRTPVYVDLTHADLAFPVVRALIPGLELAADRDAFSRVPLRLYKNYCAMFG